MQLDARGDLSVVEIAVYTPLLLLALQVCRRHGFKKSSGWIFLPILCLIRIVGAALYLATYSSPSPGPFIAVAVLDSVGISPLLLATIGILSQLVKFSSAPFLTNKQFRILKVVVIVGMILSVVGGITQATTTANGSEITTPTKIGIPLYIAGFIAAVVVLIVASTRLDTVPKGEHRIALGVALATPFIAVRLVFSALVVFVHNGTFNIVGGSIGVYAGMAIVEEFIVVVIYVALGWLLQSHERTLDVPKSGETAGVQQVLIDNNGLKAGL